MDRPLLRQLPKMDALLACPAFTAAREELPYFALRDAARAELDALRQGILDGSVEALPEPDALAAAAVVRARTACRPHLRRVINGTGVVLHTNLGRAPMGEAAAKAVYETALGYSDLEYDIDAGRRGSRFDHVEPLLRSLTGAEAALAVNNNAAAVFLMLSALAAGKKVAISRGELVEIGGSFRVPEIMARSGAELVEVGTTNKTHLSDYRRAVEEQGAQILLKVHTSNFKLIGFTEEVPLADLTALGRELGVPVLHDLGSGALFTDPALGVPEGPTVEDSVKAGADVVCFSGDKLLGGPQAGIAIGRKDLIGAMKRDQFARVVRIDKLGLAALEATLRAYQDHAYAAAHIPVLAMLGASPAELERQARLRAGELAARLGDRCVLSAVPDVGEVGGGSLPGVELPTWVVELRPARMSVAALEKALRSWEVPIVGRVSHDRCLLDPRTLSAADWADITAALDAILP
ncbi:L-seryl-tRNA(Sec) selenium transferase [Pseudoflavonifractor sp. MSJ-37]|uniref:L-seryl-tRNA(Sec) selenium transferase n=1 Tax=Pseudoflavonifractor sp. MSJ-37 TaxID=2841531 RepID=UPI001C0FCA84|nr:L-seryl-tRNA(Sec) selenium transferase [Pseudoflavonifractor sp. MSJ-37]MBU5435255.1 L-seryl-tRNA(Sec) selenium transferase [Pseudoflavonifractor sp. MSJ-37]